MNVKRVPCNHEDTFVPFLFCVVELTSFFVSSAKEKEELEVFMKANPKMQDQCFHLAFVYSSVIQFMNHLFT